MRFDKYAPLRVNQRMALAAVDLLAGVTTDTFPIHHG
jgi:hypothetical protein